MKNFFLILVIVFQSGSAFSQAPQAFNYQAVARISSTGELIQNNSHLHLLFSIRDSSTSTLLYQEEHLSATNQFGLFSVKIGTGTATSGTFAGINWGGIDPYLLVAIDTSVSGTNYQQISNSRLVSVPYAMYAAQSGDWIRSGNNLVNTNTGNLGVGVAIPLHKLHLEASTTGSDTSVLYVRRTNAAGSNANVAAIRGISDIDDNYGIGGHFKGGYIGAMGNVIPSGSNPGLSYYGTIGMVNGGTGYHYGVYGNSSGNGINYGIFGESENYGVYGNSGSGTGVYGKSITNFGAEGITSTGQAGVYGRATTGWGVQGYAFSDSMPGVYGFGANNNGTGVTGLGNGLSVYRLKSGGSGVAGTGGSNGIAGYSTNSSADTAFGGYFEDIYSGFYSYVGGRISSTGYGILSNGTKSTMVSDSENKNRIMFCPEAPEVLFQDYGSGQLENGFASISLDDVFARNVVINEQHPLRVFVQLEDDCNGVFIPVKNASGFEVHELKGGTSNAKFTWQVVANRADMITENGVVSKFSSQRFPEGPSRPNSVQVNVSTTE